MSGHREAELSYGFGAVMSDSWFGLDEQGGSRLYGGIGMGSPGTERSGVEGEPIPIPRRRRGGAGPQGLRDLLHDSLWICQYRSGRRVRRVDRGRSLVAQGLVRTPRVVSFKPFLQSGAQRYYRRVLEEVNLLVFHATPQPFDEHVVHPAALAVHTDRNAVSMKDVRERL